MSEFLNTELKHLGCLVREAITSKEKTMHAYWPLNDGLQAISLYQDASEEVKKTVDDIFLHLCGKHFETLIFFYLRGIHYQEAHRQTYDELVEMANAFLKKREQS